MNENKQRSYRKIELLSSVSILVRFPKERNYKRKAFAQNSLYSLNEHYPSLHSTNRTKQSSSRRERFNNIHSQNSHLGKRTNNRHDVAFTDDREENR